MLKLVGRVALSLLLAAVLGTQVSFATTSGNNGFIQQVTPSWGATDVNQYVSISVTTDTRLSPSDISKYIKLIDANGNTVSGVRTLSGTNSTFYVDADTPLKSGETYQLVYMDSIPLTSFTTSTQQTVLLDGFTKKYPVKREVALTKSFEIGFTRSMDSGSVNQDTVWIENDNGQQVESTLELAPDQRSVTIRPIKDLVKGHMYFLKISGEAQSTNQIGVGTPVIQLFRTKHE